MPYYFDRVTDIAFEDLPLTQWEDYLIDRPYYTGGSNRKLTRAIDYWKKLLADR